VSIISVTELARVPGVSYHAEIACFMETWKELSSTMVPTLAIHCHRMWAVLTCNVQDIMSGPGSKDSKLQLYATVAVGRLLMHASEACSDAEHTEQLVALLTKAYIQPPMPQLTGMSLQPCIHLQIVLVATGCVANGCPHLQQEMVRTWDMMQLDLETRC
jgi:hypothetical protein